MPSVYRNILSDQRLGNKTLTSSSVNRPSFPSGGTTVKYFSGVDAEIYFEDIYIDDIAQFAFQLQQNTMPLFGYNSYVYDDIAAGSRLISGQFTINFTQSGYLFEVLNTLKNASVKAKESVINTQKENIISEFDQRLTSLIANGGGDPMIQYKQSPLWGSSFSIVLSYGDKFKTNAPDSTMYILTGVRITGVAQGFGSSGEAIMETYSFVAQDMLIMPKSKEKATPVIQTKPVEKEPFVLDYAEYTEEMGWDGSYMPRAGVPIIQKPIGKIAIKYEADSDLTVTSVKIAPDLRALFDARISDGGARDVMINGNPIVYTVPSDLREDIRKFYALGVARHNGQFKANVIVDYLINGVRFNKVINTAVKFKSLL